MNKKEAIEYLGRLYPFVNQMGWPEEYYKYKTLIERFEWSSSDLSWLINAIRNAKYLERK